MAGILRSQLYGQVDDRYLKSPGWFDAQERIPMLCWRGVKLTYQDLIDTGETDTNATINPLVTVPAGTLVHHIMVNLITGFDATVTLTDAVLIVGDATDPNGFLTGLADQDDNGGTTGLQAIDLADLGAYLKNDVATTPAVDEREPVKIYTAATALQATLTVTGDTINDLTQGELDIWLLVSNPLQGVVLNAGST